MTPLSPAAGGDVERVAMPRKLTPELKEWVLAYFERWPATIPEPKATAWDFLHAYDALAAHVAALAPRGTGAEWVVGTDHPSVESTVKAWNAIALFLWDLLDNIDTASDMAKGDDKAYREAVERIQRRRFEVGTTDGQTVQFAARQI
jgi:hypothetical protein